VFIDHAINCSMAALPKVSGTTPWGSALITRAVVQKWAIGGAVTGKWVAGGQQNFVIHVFFFPAPEVLGPEKYDKSCDMWSLGVITYIM